MYKIHEKFPDFDGNMIEDDFYFNLTEQELTEMQFGVAGGMVAMLQKIIGSKSTPELIKYFKEILIASYGQKDPDGIHFRKSQQIIDDFVSTNAFSQIYMRLATNEEEAQKFINGVMPKRAKQENNQGTIPFPADKK